MTKNKTDPVNTAVLNAVIKINTAYYTKVGSKLKVRPRYFVFYSLNHTIYLLTSIPNKRHLSFNSQVGYDFL